jgi:hypothetical protein
MDPKPVRRSVRVRFQADIKKDGVNSYVDVPRTVSDALKRFTLRGRILFEGSLNKTAVSGSLVPTASGAHRIYVNGGMRSAAKVAIGDRVAFTLVVYRDRIAFMVRVRFAGATPKREWLDVDFWLTPRIDHPRFTRVETISATVHVHRLRVRETSDLDNELIAWIRQAYAIGCQEHLRRPLAD